MIHKPAVAVLMLQPKCNMFCSFCITENSMGSFSLHQANHLLDELKLDGVKSLVIGGGEPLLWKENLFNFADQARQKGFHVQVGTNGILLPDNFEKLHSVDRWVLPLDGSQSEIHNSVRVFEKGHFDLITSRIQNLREVKKSATISTVILKPNYSDIKNIALFLEKLNRGVDFIHAWHLYQFIPEGRGGAKHKQELTIPGEDYENIVNEIKSMNLSFKVFKRPKMLNSKTVAFFWSDNERTWGQLGKEQFSL